MTKKNVVQPQDKYVLRLPDGMRELLKAEAERNKRSMNAEIVARLSEYDEIRSFWDRADALKDAVQGLETSLDVTRKVVEELRAENDKLRLELARTQGMNESLQHGVNIFMDRLMMAAGEKGVSMPDLLHAITKPEPDQGK